MIMETVSMKIGSSRLKRRAIVYLRQSSTRQVRENLESQRLQYALADRARALGWRDVETIDSDLGSSASIGAAPRPGFERLVSAVALGEVGIVLSREVSRLSRTDKDFCHLIEVCQIFGTLIADEAQIYDPAQLDDQLILGLKGTLSVVELKTLQLRMRQGQLEKERRGELLCRLPTGYVLGPDGRPLKDPNGRVQEAIELVFKKFRDLWTIRQTFMWFHEQGIDLPVNTANGNGVRVEWRLPKQLFIAHILRNPFYAGAYVYGRRATESVVVDGRVLKRAGRLRRAEQCRTFIPDHHEGYIGWEEFEENLKMIERNSSHAPAEESVASVRTGKGLLAGLLRCGHCGRRLHVRYWGRSGTNARYLCVGDYLSGGRYCLAFAGGPVDRRLGKELLAALSPLGVETSLAATAQLQAIEDERVAVLSRQCEQLEYEANRAFEQYDEVDPRNRLVAAELERRWNAKLEELNRSKAAVAHKHKRHRLPDASQRARVHELAENFETVWNHPRCPVELRKKIVRTAVEEIIATLSEDRKTLHFVVHWSGGVHTRFEMPKPRSAAKMRTSPDAIDVIRKMAVRYGDDQIAAILNRLGHTTGKGNRWTQSRVAAARHTHSIPGQTRTKLNPEILNLKQAATYCGVCNKTIERLARSGLLPMQQVVPLAPWEIKKSDLDSGPVRGIVERLRRTGKLDLDGGGAANQTSLFPENTEDL